MSCPATGSGSIRRTHAALCAVETSGVSLHPEQDAANPMTANGSSPSGGKSGDGVSEERQAALLLLNGRLAKFHAETRETVSAVYDATQEPECFDWEELSDLYSLQHELRQIVDVAELLVDGAPHPAAEEVCEEVE